jgi:RNA polymerase sigma-70 factor, ECF subfamily
LEVLGRSPAAEESLAARIRSGDHRAFRTLFDRHGLAIWRFLHDLMGDPTSADEGVQETFVRAFSTIDRLRDDGRLLGWLLGIARNVAKEQLRVRRRDRPPGASEIPPESPEAIGVHVPEDALGPERWLLGREAESLLSRALAELAEDRRAALLLRVDHGLGYDEIARVMGWSVAKVKNEIHRARTRLRELLQSFHGGDP